MVSPETVELVEFPVLHRAVFPLIHAVVRHLLRCGLEEDIVASCALLRVVPYAEHAERFSLQLRVFRLHYPRSRSRLQLLLDVLSLGIEGKRNQPFVYISLAAGGKANGKEGQYAVFQYLGHIFSIFSP